MVKKKELQNKIEDLENQLAELKKQVNTIEDEGIKKGVRQTPKVGDKYFYFYSGGLIVWSKWQDTELDLFRFNTGNCFKTEQEAKDFKENILTKQALKDLALELNNGVKIDWKSEKQDKYYLYLDHKTNILSMNWVYTEQDNNIYCLNVEFLIIAKDRIGEEKLINLIKSGV